MIGDSYSQRTPSIERERRAHAPVVGDVRRIGVAAEELVGLPNASAVVCGSPSRKSAKSKPVRAPVNANVPRGSCWPTTSLADAPEFAARRDRVATAEALDLAADDVAAGARLRVAAVAQAGEVAGKLSPGGPQFSGSWSLPTMPASPETFVTPGEVGQRRCSSNA